MKNKYHLHLSSIYHLLHYACCPLLLLIKFPLAMLTCCAADGAPDKCSLDVTALRECRLDNGMVVWFFLSFFFSIFFQKWGGLFTLWQRAFPSAHFWLLSRRLAGQEEKMQRGGTLRDWRGGIKEGFSWNETYFCICHSCIKMRTSAWGYAGEKKHFSEVWMN